MKKEEDKVTKMLKNAQKIITLFVICKYSKHETKKTSLQCKTIFYIGVDHITSNFWRYTSVSYLLSWILHGLLSKDPSSALLECIYYGFNPFQHFFV